MSHSSIVTIPETDEINNGIIHNTNTASSNLKHRIITDNSSIESMRPSSKIRLFRQTNNLKMSPNNLNQVLPIQYPKDFEVIWYNINYKVKTLKRNRMKLEDKQILYGLNGHFNSGQVTAIMGPSGAGKSTLLEILACRRRFGLSGDLKLKDIENVRISFVPQNTYLMESLTVYETMMFAARMQRSDCNDYDFNGKINELISMFAMEKIRHTRVNRCSGGQRKRVSIALELFQNPNILILDEPTTGLDSASCSSVMNLLKELVDNREYPLAVVCTIHQPSWTLFTQIDHVYIMTKYGRCLYTGSPNKLLPLLNRCDLPCDPFNSPSDFIIELAAEDYGTEPIEKLTKYLDEGVIGRYDHNQIQSLPNLRSARIIRKIPFWGSLVILMQRAGILYRRNLLIVALRIISIILITIWLQLMFGSEIGKVSGCAMKKLELYATPIDKLSTMFEESILAVSQNGCCLFFGLMVGMISGMTSVVLEFPRDMHILMKEYNNGWYSCITYLITKSIVDIPLQLIIPSIYVAYMYEFTSQPKQLYREGYLLFITIMVGFVSESIGSICSAIFMDNPMAAAMSAGSVPLPMVLFGGFLVKYSRMPVYMQIASWTSLLKYAFEGIMVTMYGFDRCSYSYNQFLNSINVSAIEKPIWARYLPMILSFLSDGEDFEAPPGTPEIDEDQIVIDKMYTTTFKALNTASGSNDLNIERSLILSYFELESDNILYFSLVAMIVYYVVMKVLTYLIILAKLNSSI
ncbi:ABC protein, sub ABCG [Blomia tropicalis]|nr:ABC protein, sub ABCG [Blomia tropicalis]